MEHATQPLNVLMVTDRWDEAGGGRERYQSELRRSLARSGHHITVLARQAHGERRLRPAIAAFCESHHSARVLALRPAMGATHYQLHSGVYAAAFAAEREAYDSSIRRLLYRPALALNTRRQRLLDIEARMLAGSAPTQVMAFSSASQADLHRLFGFPAERVTLDRPGVDLDVFHPPQHDSQRGQIRLLFAGHNFVLKGLRWALEALARARRSGADATLIVAGNGPHRAFSALARRLHVEPHVHFAGDVSQYALAGLYRHSDLLIHPAFYDPFPRVIVEALASGVPVVTTATCGGADLITHGRNGFVIGDPRDIEALAEAIASVAAPDRRRKLSVAAAVTGRRLDFHRHASTVAQWLSPTYTSAL